jgi:hypothetical protein
MCPLINQIAAAVKVLRRCGYFRKEIDAIEPLVLNFGPQESSISTPCSATPNTLLVGLEL